MALQYFANLNYRVNSANLAPSPKPLHAGLVRIGPVGVENKLKQETLQFPGKVM